MTGPQIIIAAGLVLNAVAVLYGARRLRTYLPVLRGRQHSLVRHLWLAAFLPVGEAVVLWQGGFWS